jgi:hypothetical protein
MSPDINLFKKVRVCRERILDQDGFALPAHDLALRVENNVQMTNVPAPAESLSFIQNRIQHLVFGSNNVSLISIMLAG